MIVNRRIFLQRNRTEISQDESSDNSGEEPETPSASHQVVGEISSTEGIVQKIQDSKPSPPPSIDNQVNGSWGVERKDKSQRYKKGAF
jgi:hypothetical protein